MYLLILICLLRPTSSTQSTEQPVLQEVTLPKNLIQNQTVRLTCASIQGDNVEFSWYFNSEKLLQNNRKQIKLGDGSSDLLIKQLSVDDIGVYGCVGSNELGSDQKSVELIFEVKPNFYMQPKNVTVPLGKELKIDCLAKGYPKPDTKIKKMSIDKKTALREFSSNRIKLNFSKDDAGLYKCIATNLVGEIETMFALNYFGKYPSYKISKS